MRPLLRRLFPYLLLTLFALPALWPLTGPGLPRTNDALPHFYRALELSELFRAGVYFPRWAPHLVHGYGYPVFNFFPYLAHALIAGLHLAGLNLLNAYNLACALVLLASAFFAYRLGRSHFGQAAGLVAGVAYLYSPYLLYDTYVRGSLPESLALALLPLALLYLRRAVRGHWLAAAWAALALAAALLAHHGVMLQAMPFIVAYALFTAWRRPAASSTNRAARPIARMTLSRTYAFVWPFVLALLLSAFFWLPALLEAGYVQIERGTGNSGMSYLENFLSLGELLAWPRLPVDPLLLNPPVVRALPHAALLLAALAWLRWLVARPRQASSRAVPSGPAVLSGRALLFFSLAALAGTLLILPLARPLWDALPLLRLTLFPWRLLGPISLFLALAAGALFAETAGSESAFTPAPRRRARQSLSSVQSDSPAQGITAEAPLSPMAPAQPVPDQAVPSRGHKAIQGTDPVAHLRGTHEGEPLARRSPTQHGTPPLWFSSTGEGSGVGATLAQPLALLLLVLAGLPFAAPPREPAPAEPTLADLANFEIPPDFIGTTTVGEYLPRWIEQLPDTGGDRLRLMLGETPPRFDAPGAVVASLDDRAIGAAYSVAAAEPVRFVYRVFYFPGWHALLDGQRAPLEITSPDGLMAVAVPPGAHSLTFSLGPTLIRLAGNALTLLGLLAVLAWIAYPTLLAWRASHTTAIAATDVPVPLVESPPSLLGKGAGGLGSPPAQSLILLPLALLLALARPLFFDAGRTPLLRPGLSASGLAGVPPLNLDVAGELTLLGAEIAPAALTGDQSLSVNLYWRATHPLGVAHGFDLRLVDSAGQPWSEPDVTRPRNWRFTPGTDFWPADQYILDPYTLTPTPGLPPGDYTVQVTVFARHNLQAVGAYPAGQVVVTAPTRARVCPEAVPSVPAAALDLRSAELPAFSRPGDDLTVSLCWQAVVAPGADLAGEVRVLDALNQVRAAQPFTLGGPYPTSRWAPGDVLRDRVTLRLPPEIETGEYTWALVVAGGPQIGLGALDVTAPERQFTSPAVGQVLGADLGPITLFGLTLPAEPLAPGAQVPLSLVWRADDSPVDNYHVFVHLQSSDGAIVAQSDGVPADWSRRTAGWLRGEFVLDERILQLPADLAPGAYALFAGLYQPATGARLATPALPDGRVPLGVVQVD